MNRCVILCLLAVSFVGSMLGVLFGDDGAGDETQPDPCFVQSDRRGMAIVMDARKRSDAALKMQKALALFHLRLFEASRTDNP